MEALLMVLRSAASMRVLTALSKKENSSFWSSAPIDDGGCVKKISTLWVSKERSWISMEGMVEVVGMLMCLSMVRVLFFFSRELDRVLGGLLLPENGILLSIFGNSGELSSGIA